MRCGHCPLDRLDASEESEQGHLLQRTLDLRAMLRAGLNLTLDDIDADELYVMLAIQEEQNRYDEDQSKGS